MPRTTESQKGRLVHDVHEFSLNIDTREIFMIEEYHDGERITNHAALIKNLAILHSTSQQPILIHMVNAGGDVGHGLAIHDAIKSSPCNITILSYGYVCSMGSVILQAADKRVLMPNTEMLLHNITMSSENKIHGVMADVIHVQKLQDILLNIYVEQAAKAPHFQRRKKEDIKRFFSDTMTQRLEWYITPEDAVKYGLADGILGKAGYEGIDTLCT